MTTQTILHEMSLSVALMNLTLFSSSVRILSSASVSSFSTKKISSFTIRAGTFWQEPV